MILSQIGVTVKLTPKLQLKFQKIPVAALPLEVKSYLCRDAPITGAAAAATETTTTTTTTTKAAEATTQPKTFTKVRRRKTTYRRRKIDVVQKVRKI
jgi:hypothetical protein